MHALPPHRRARHLRPRAAAALAIVLLTATAAGKAAPPVGTFATWGTWAAVALPDGKIVLVDVASSSRSELQAPGAPILALAVVPALVDGASGLTPPGPPDLAVALPGSGGHSSRLLILNGSDSSVRARANLPFIPARLMPGPAGKVVYAVGIGESARGRGRRAESSRGWTLQAIDLTEKEPKAVGVSLSAPVSGSSVGPLGERIYLAERDRIRTFATDPMRSSWQLRSPGNNRAVVGFASGTVLVARNEELARIDPSDLPGKDPNTGAPPTDDALARLALPFRPEAISISADGDEAALLDEEGTRLALVDLAAWEVREVRVTPGAATAVFHPERPALFVFERDGDLVEMVYSPPPPQAAPVQEPEPALAEAEVPAPAEEPDAAPQAVTPSAETGWVPAVEPPSGRAEAETAGAAPTAPPPPGPRPTSASPAEAAAGASAAEEAEMVTRAAVPSEPPPEPEIAPAPAALSGRVTGEWRLVTSLVLYGPDSIVREHMRIAVGDEGSFSSPLPPSGRYRLVPAAANGLQLNVNPPLRILTVAEEGIDGLDFEVAGKISGTLAH